MNDTISRADALAAIEAIKVAVRYYESDRWHNHALDEALAAINALPAVSVTDDMVERATYALMDALKSRWVSISDDPANCYIDGGEFDLREVTRAALEAALPDAPKD